MEFKGGLGESDNSSLMVGPNVMLRQDKWFAGGSFLFSLNDYEFNESASESGLTLDRKVKASRRDLDLIGGYTIHPNISLYAGYKRTNMTFDNSFTFSNSNSSVSASSNDDYSFSGFGFGVIGNKAINEKVILFGSFGLLRFKDKGLGDSEKMDGIAIEFGASMPIQPNMAVSASYKTQRLEYKTTGGDLIFGGLAATFNYAF